MVANFTCVPMFMPVDATIRNSRDKQPAMRISVDCLCFRPPMHAADMHQNRPEKRAGEAGGKARAKGCRPALPGQPDGRAGGIRKAAGGVGASGPHRPMREHRTPSVSTSGMSAQPRRIRMAPSFGENASPSAPPSLPHSRDQHWTHANTSPVEAATNTHHLPFGTNK
jgi:hypothetical protein